MFWTLQTEALYHQRRLGFFIVIDYISEIVFSCVIWIPEFKTEIENLNEVTKKITYIKELL